MFIVKVFQLQLQAIDLHYRKSLLLKRMFGSQTPKCVIPRRPRWYQNLIGRAPRWAKPWCVLHCIDAVCRLWYWMRDAAMDTLVVFALKTGLIDRVE